MMMSLGTLCERILDRVSARYSGRLPKVAVTSKTRG